MEENEIIEMLAAILLQREGGEITLDRELMECKEFPSFKFKIGQKRIKVILNP